MMKKREKLLAMIVAGFAVALALYVIGGKVLFTPASALSVEINSLQLKIADLEKENLRGASYSSDLNRIAAMTYDPDELRTSEMARARLGVLLELSGLSGESMSLKPTAGRREPGVYRELGWYVHTRGKLAQVLNLLYLLQREPRLHQMDELTVQPSAYPGEIDVQFRYLTLVLEPAKGQKPPATAPADKPIIPADLNAPERALYHLIANRDIMRPYIPRPPAVAVTPQWQPPNPGHTEPPRTEDPSGNLAIVGLPSSSQQTDIFVKDIAAQTSTAYHLGDEVCGGKIVLVDYRPLPRLDQPSLISPSRVVLQFDQELWAVELGMTFSNRYRLTEDRLPPELRSTTPEDSPAPATQPVVQGS